MESYIKNELKLNKIPPKNIIQGIEPRTYILAGDRCRPISKPTGHPVEGLQSTYKLHYVSVYMQRACAMGYRASIGHNRF